MPTVIDHLLAIVLIVGLPIHAYVKYSGMCRRRDHLRERGERCDNVPDYRWTIALQWGLTIAMLASWFGQSRTAADLGIVVPPQRALWNGWGFVVAAGITIAVVILLAWQSRAVKRSEKMRASVREQIEPVRDILPTTPRELRWFTALSVTAGVCEELLYRAWMLWYLSQAMSLWAAVPLQALIFGIAHAYQGMSGLAKTSPIGLVAAGLYVIGGSIWSPMLLHVAIDHFSGRMAFDAINEPSGETSSPTATARAA